MELKQKIIILNSDYCTLSFWLSGIPVQLAEFCKRICHSSLHAVVITVDVNLICDYVAVY
jgi:hypothetical protein